MEVGKWCSLRLRRCFVVAGGSCMVRIEPSCIPRSMCRCAENPVLLSQSCMRMSMVMPMPMLEIGIDVQVLLLMKGHHQHEEMHMLMIAVASSCRVSAMSGSGLKQSSASLVCCEEWKTVVDDDLQRIGPTIIYILALPAP